MTLGIKSIAECRAYAAQHPDFLSQTQAVCLKHVEDLQQRIPRAEAGAIFGSVREQVRILGFPAAEMECCGSFRRGKAYCGDVDVLICSAHESLEENRRFMKQLVRRLHDHGGWGAPLRITTNYQPPTEEEREGYPPPHCAVAISPDHFFRS